MVPGDALLADDAAGHLAAARLAGLAGRLRLASAGTVTPIGCFPAGAAGRYPAGAGGPWLCRTLVLSGFHAVVVPSGFRTSVQPHRWITT